MDIDDPELAEFPQLAAAVSERMRLPMVQVGEQVKHPSGISIYWIEAQLASLGVEPFATPEVSPAVVEEGS